MKHMQKLTCLLLALLMVLSLGITAFAVDPDPIMQGPDQVGIQGKEPETNGNGTIKIKDMTPGEEYKLYQIFYLVSYGNSFTKGDVTDSIVGTSSDIIHDSNGNITDGNYVYGVNTYWKEFVTTGAGKNYVSIDSNGAVTWSPNDSTGTGTDRVKAQAFAQAAIAYAKEKGIQPVATFTPPLKNADGTLIDYPKDSTTQLPVAEHTFENLKLGYYLVDSTLGSLCALDTTHPHVVMEEKNGVPTNEKKVLEGGNWGSQNDADIGDDVRFKSVVKIESGLDKLVYHDKMDEGLTFNEHGRGDYALSVVYDAEDIVKATSKAKTLTAGTDYTVETTDLGDDCTFHIVFKESFLKSIEVGDHDLTICYSAKLNEQAVVRGEGNKNTSHVSYGDKNSVTPKSETVTKTWAIPVFKYGVVKGDPTNAQVPLAGAVFKLSTDKDPDDPNAKPAPHVAEPIPLVPLGEKEVVIGKNADGSNMTAMRDCYRVATQEEIANKKTDANPTGVEIVTEITTNDTGRFWIMGLDAGTYYLHEIAAPSGYKKLTAPATVVLTSKGGIKQNESGGADDGKATVISIQNGTGTEMPSTGGIGTTIFYVVGSILLIGAGVLLVTKKRMSAQQ